MGKASRLKRERRLGLLARQQEPAVEARPVEVRPIEARPGFFARRKKGRGRSGKAALSSRLLELFPDDSWLDEASFEEVCSGIGVAGIAWNLTLLDERESKREMRKMLREAERDGVCDPAALGVLLIELMARKLTLFPDDTRFVVEWDVQQRRNQFRLSVTSLQPPED